jgi:hypothetical protein
MTNLTQLVRVSLLTIGLAFSGCVLAADDDDLDVDESAVIDEDTAVVSVETSNDPIIVECRTKCEQARTQCNVSCADNVCIGGCDTKRKECFTDCD